MAILPNMDKTVYNLIKIRLTVCYGKNILIIASRHKGEK